MASGLALVQKALVGEIVMTEELENMSDAIYNNQVPPSWQKKGFLSLKPLASWIEDCNKRIDFLNDWIRGGTPIVYWVSGFFFPQAFFTGNLQNYARSNTIAVDKISFGFDFKDTLQAEDIKEKPASGCLTYGMYIEGSSGTMKLICSTNLILRSCSWSCPCFTSCRWQRERNLSPAST